MLCLNLKETFEFKHDKYFAKTIYHAAYIAHGKKKKRK